MTKVLVLLSVFVSLLATFATAAVLQDDNLLFDPHFETPVIESHRQSPILHRVKKGTWDFLGSDEKMNLKNTANFEHEQDVEDPSLTESPTIRDGAVGDDEDYLEEGSGDTKHEGSTTEADVISRSNSQTVPLPVDQPAPAPGRQTIYYYYHVNIIIMERYSPNLSSPQSNEFKNLSSQLSQAIDGLYRSALPNQPTRCKIYNFLQTSDRDALEVYLHIQSSSFDEKEMRSVLAEQLKLGMLGDIRVLASGFSFGKLRGRGYPDFPTTSTAPTVTPYWEHQMIRCKNSTDCFESIQRCDGKRDCADNSDEEDCPRPGAAARQCDPNTEFASRISGECLPVSARCGSLVTIIDEFETTTTKTTSEAPKASVDCAVESLSEAVEKKLAVIDELNKSVQQLTDTVKNLIATNEFLNKKREVFQTANTEEDLDQRISQLIPNQSTTQSSDTKHKFMELACRAFSVDLIIEQRKYFP